MTQITRHATKNSEKRGSSVDTDQAKQVVRERVWALLERERVAPPGVHGRIPAFFGAEAAADRGIGCRQDVAGRGHGKTSPAWKISPLDSPSGECVMRSRTSCSFLVSTFDPLSAFPVFFESLDNNLT